MIKPNVITAMVAIMLPLVITSLVFAQQAAGVAKPPEEITTKELKALLDERQSASKAAAASGQPAEESKFVLVDVRSPEEVAVSIIPGAITKQQFEKEKEKYRDKLIIPYCLVGGRSTSYANELKKSGLAVRNYKGSIAEWVSAELPLVTVKGESTNRVFINPERLKVPAKYEAVGK